MATLLRALAEEIAVVVAVILIFCCIGRSALVPLLTLAVVRPLTFAGMWLLGVPATIMSLGGIGIALGMAVDADIVALEASHRRLESRHVAGGAAGGATRDRLAAAHAFAPAILTSLRHDGALVLLPVLAFSGETGRLLRPLAHHEDAIVMVAAASSTLTLAPALRDRLLRGRVRPELDNPLTRTLVRLYRPFVHFALAGPRSTLATAALALASCLPIIAQRKLGGEFLPRVDEGDLLYMPTTLPGVPPEQAAFQLYWQDHAISQFAEVATVFGKVGRADTGTDPGALRDGGDDDPAAAARRVADGRAPALVLGLGAGARCGRCSARLARRTPRTTAELAVASSTRGAAAGLDGRLDGARARAHGHDGDRRAHARRHPHRVARPARLEARRPRCARASRAFPARERRVRVAGGRDLAGVRCSTRRRCATRRRPGEVARGRRPAHHRRPDRRGGAGRTGPRCARARA